MNEKKIIRLIETEELGGTDGTWAQVTRRGGLAFISGQIALDTKGEIVGKGNFEQQAKQALDNLVSALKAVGAGLSDLMMITVFVTDMANRTIFAKVRDAYFRSNPPASTIVEINRLCMDELLIEVNGIAFLD